MLECPNEQSASDEDGAMQLMCEAMQSGIESGTRKCFNRCKVVK